MATFIVQDGQFINGSGHLCPGEHLKIEITQVKNGYVAKTAGFSWVFTNFQELSNWLEEALKNGISYST